MRGSMGRGLWIGSSSRFRLIRGWAGRHELESRTDQQDPGEHGWGWRE